MIEMHADRNLRMDFGDRIHHVAQHDIMGVGARAYAHDVMLRHMMDAVTEIHPQIPVCVHLDHGNGPDTCMTAIQAGFTSVMMDGSLKSDGKTAADWDY